jgi:hypothetical protein
VAKILHHIDGIHVHQQHVDQGWLKCKGEAGTTQAFKVNNALPEVAQFVARKCYYLHNGFIL